MERLLKVTAAREFDLGWPVLACAVGRPDDESRSRLRRLYLESGPAAELWVYGEPQRPPSAVIGIRLGDPAEITHIAVREGSRRQGLGRRLFAHMQAGHPDATCWMAETDDDAVGFYRVLGFQAEVLPPRYAGVRRYRCTWTSGGGVSRDPAMLDPGNACGSSGEEAD